MSHERRPGRSIPVSVEKDTPDANHPYIKAYTGIAKEWRLLMEHPNLGETPEDALKRHITEAFIDPVIAAAEKGEYIPADDHPFAHEVGYVGTPNQVVNNLFLGARAIDAKLPGWREWVPDDLALQEATERFVGDKNLKAYFLGALEDRALSMRQEEQAVRQAPEEETPEVSADDVVQQMTKVAVTHGGESPAPRVVKSLIDIDDVPYSPKVTRQSYWAQPKPGNEPVEHAEPIQPKDFDYAGVAIESKVQVRVDVTTGNVIDRGGRLETMTVIHIDATDPDKTYVTLQDEREDEHIVPVDSLVKKDDGWSAEIVKKLAEDKFVPQGAKVIISGEGNTTREGIFLGFFNAGDRHYSSERKDFAGIKLSDSEPLTWVHANEVSRAWQANRRLAQAYHPRPTTIQRPQLKTRPR